jgi:hypothetical protein
MRGTLEGPWKILRKKIRELHTKQIPACEEGGEAEWFRPVSFE